MQPSTNNNDCSTPSCQKQTRNRARSQNKLRIRHKVRSNVGLHVARNSARALLAVIAAQLMLQVTALPVMAQDEAPTAMPTQMVTHPALPTPDTVQLDTATPDTTQLEALAPDQPDAFASLTALSWTASVREPLRIGANTNDKPCLLNGKPYDDCLGLGTQSTLTYTSAALGGFSRLTAQIGLDDGVNDPAQCSLAGQPDQAATAVVYIQADNNVVYNSGALLRDAGNVLGARIRKIDIALPTGTKTLKITVSGATINGTHCDMVDIVEGTLSGEAVQRTVAPIASITPTPTNDSPLLRQTVIPTPFGTRATHTPPPHDQRTMFLPLVFKPVAVTSKPTPSPTPAVSKATPTVSPSPTATTPKTTPVPESAGGEWPQLGHDAQRSNATPTQVDAPFCYSWKWNQVPLAARAQPVVANGILYLGSMNGWLYARNARTGAQIWAYETGGPIRNSAGVLSGTVVFGSHDGWTYAVDAATGALKWKTETGSTATAPLLDAGRRWAYVASSNGSLTALNIEGGTKQWQKTFNAPIWTSPSLSSDGQTVFFGTQAMQAIAVNAATGDTRWQQTLQGQSLAERYPVVAGNTVMYRSQPLYFLHEMLHQGDAAMDKAGPLLTDWNADWQNVRPKIVEHLNQNPAQQTFFALDATTGASRGIAPMLYTYGLGDIPNMPVLRDGAAYVTYRARHGIQTDSGSVHVTTKYDAEIGRMNLDTLDITGLTGQKLSVFSGWRMTSDEPSMLTLGGDMLWVDSWERGGAFNTKTGAHSHLAGLGNETADCIEWCGGTNMPFFPLTGTGPSWPRPMITGEGRGRAGIVIAANHVFWRAQGAGLAALTHQNGGVCPTTIVYGPSSNALTSVEDTGESIGESTARTLADYVSLDLTTPVANPPADLVERLRREVRDIVTSGGHLMPLYIERGFSISTVWPAGSPKTAKDVPQITYQGRGNGYWFDPGELLYTLALAYPYLDSDLQQKTRSYVQAETARFSPLKSLPYADPNADWLRSGIAREPYSVPFRKDLNSWPPPSVSPSVFYALWLWSKNSGDWSYACGESATIRALYDGMKSKPTFPRYYADIGGLIGYARLSKDLAEKGCSGWNTGYAAENINAATTALQTGKNWSDFRTRTNVDFPDPRELSSGLSLPAFFGLTPEIGLFLAEQTGGAAQDEINAKQSNVGVPWWYLTRAGEHGEEWETTFLGPQTAWSHFLARAYVSRSNQATLRKWLDIPWAKGDLYSIQKVVATIQAGA